MGGKRGPEKQWLDNLRIGRAVCRGQACIWGEVCIWGQANYVRQTSYVSQAGIGGVVQSAGDSGGEDAADEEFVV